MKNGLKIDHSYMQNEQTFKGQLEKWRARALDTRYLVIYLDAICIKVEKQKRTKVYIL